MENQATYISIIEKALFLKNFNFLFIIIQTEIVLF